MTAVGALLVLLSFVAFLFAVVAFAIAVVALIRGHLDWARITTRRVGLFVLLGSMGAFVISGALLPQPPRATPSAAVPLLSAPAAATSTPSPTATSSPTGPVPGAPANVQGPFRVIEVVDGDTYRIARPEGAMTLRLIGIDTPETRDPDRPVECFAKEATQAAQQLVGSKTVWLGADSTQDAQDRHGRQLVYVWLADGTLVNEKLIRDGAGIEYTYEKPYLYQTAFRAAQDEARQAGWGLWAVSTCNGNADLAAQQPTTQAPAPQKTQGPVSLVQKPAPTPKPPSVERYYASCDAARAAGAAPLHRGDPGYRSGLDRDKDGVACE